MRTLKWMSVACLLLPLAAFGQPQVEIELLAVDPAEASAVALFTPVHARIRYRTDAPVRLVLRPFRNGQPVQEGVYYSGSPWYPPPEGEGLAWFGFSEAARIDEIRALATDNFGNEFARATIERPLAWQPGLPKSEPAPWVERLKRQSERLLASQHTQSDETGVGDALLLVFIQLLFLLVPASVVLQIVALRKLDRAHGGLARLSAIAMAALWLFVIVTGFAGSNLSPIWLVFLSPLFVVFLSVLLLHHRTVTRASANRHG